MCVHICVYMCIICTCVGLCVSMQKEKRSKLDVLLNCFPPHFFLRQGLSPMVRLLGQQAAGTCLSLSPKWLGYRCTPMCLTFHSGCRPGITTEVLRLPRRALYHHLPYTNSSSKLQNNSKTVLNRISYITAVHT